MDHDRFDALTLVLGSGGSRRSIIKGLGAAALGAAGMSTLGAAEAASSKSNSACAAFCAQVFGADTKAAGRCTSQAAKGAGPCVACGGNPGNYCNGACVDLSSDPNNCGACGAACEGGQKCFGGSCYNFCAATSFCCESTLEHGGACGGDSPGSYCAPPYECISCPGRCCADGCTPDGSTIGTGSITGCCLPGDDACRASLCPNDNCPIGKTLCGEICVDLQFNAANCGTCGTRCGAGETCASGHCAQA